jgi:cyclopropane fatty-acyl-phospholipid synthase-like methyltransferase
VDDVATTVSTGYDAVADEYVALEQPGKEWPRLQLLRDLLSHLPSGSSVLDVGCGNGIPALREIARDHNGVGIDISAKQVERARANVPAADVLHGDVQELLFAPNSFDAVVALYVLDHLPREKHATFFARVHSWLRPSGLFLFSVEPDDEPGMVREWLGKPMFFSHFDAEITVGLVRDAGFEVLDARRQTQLEGETDVEFLWVLARRDER